MAIQRDLPYGNARFTVEIEGKPQPGFTVVQLPEMMLEHAEFREGGEKQLESQLVAGRPKFGTLLLKRGFRGSLYLYEWWKAASSGASGARRGVDVRLQTEDGADSVMRWHVSNAFPIRYGFAPLDGVDGGPLIEMIEIACPHVEME